MEMADVVEKAVKLKSWQYRGEGNGNIVISLKETGQILRLVKSPSAGGNSLGVLLHEDTTRLQQLLTFVQTMVLPRLGAKFVHPGQVVKIRESVMSKLSADLMAVRPVERTHRCLRVADCYALLLPDQCLLPNIWKLDCTQMQQPTWTVEIKPKMGFLATHCRSEREQHVCKYSLKQKLKMKQGKIDEISGYCPIDLFSGCPLRMMDALFSLLQCPQNNLLIFKNGELVFGGKCGKKSEMIEEISSGFAAQDVGQSKKIRDWCSLIVEILLRDHGLDDVGSPPKDDAFQAQKCCCQDNRRTRNQGTCECEFCLLKPSCVLGRLLGMQLLGDMQVEKVHDSYQKVLESFGSSARIDQMLYNGDPADAERVEPCDKLCLGQVMNFLLSCTAKDCSLMITYQQMSPGNTNFPPGDDRLIVSPSGTRFIHNVAFVDLDWKSHTRISEIVGEESEMRATNF